MSENMMEMPKYKCTKEVWGLKIKSVETFSSDGNCTLTFEDSHYSKKFMSSEYALKHKPYAGGYYVLYKGGYESFSPASDFEGGYERIN